MKDYLSSDEREKFLMVSKLADYLDVMLEWEARGFISKEEKKNIKTSSTLIFKSLKSISERLNEQNKKTIANALKSSSVVLTNDFGLRQYMKKKSSDETLCYEENKDYFDLMEEVAFQNCNGCEKHCTECKYYELWEELYISDMGDDFGNCRFSYNMPMKKKE